MIFAIVIMLWNVLVQYPFAKFRTYSEWNTYVHAVDSEIIRKIQQGELSSVDYYPENFDISYYTCYKTDVVVLLILLCCSFLIVLDKWGRKGGVTKRGRKETMKAVSGGRRLDR